MYIVEGNKTDHEGNQIKERKKFDDLEHAEKYAKEELDGYIITNSDTDEIILGEEDSRTLKEDALDMMYPDRHDEDFDQDQISAEEFFKE
jgi:hypothetical protein